MYRYKDNGLFIFNSTIWHTHINYKNMWLRHDMFYRLLGLMTADCQWYAATWPGAYLWTIYDLTFDSVQYYLSHNYFASLVIDYTQICFLWAKYSLFQQWWQTSWIFIIKKIGDSTIPGTWDCTFWGYRLDLWTEGHSDHKHLQKKSEYSKEINKSVSVSLK